MVERAYENYLVNECKTQTKYKQRLVARAQKESTAEEKNRRLKMAEEFELSRCEEFKDLFPKRYDQMQQQQQRKK
jgi:hypothetical protein